MNNEGYASKVVGSDEYALEGGDILNFKPVYNKDQDKIIDYQGHTHSQVAPNGNVPIDY